MARPSHHFGLIGAALVGGLSLAATAAGAQGIEVVMNQAKILKLGQAADTIVIGNPAIADASVQDATTIVLTGKGFGMTNLVILDQQGNPLMDEEITVTRSTSKSVRIYRRSDMQTLSCTPYCEGAYKNDAERQSESEIAAGN
jgi:Flp pilus assembly secretin CpaC